MPVATESTRQRRQAILEIIRERHVQRQSELVSLLRQRGITATQSSISRDLRRMGVTKLDEGYRPPAAGNGTEGADVPDDFVRAVDTAGVNLTVIRTATGAAQRVAVFLDRSGWPEIVGTLSGDDTIFVATRNAPDQRQLLARLRSRFLTEAEAPNRGITP